MGRILLVLAVSVFSVGSALAEAHLAAGLIAASATGVYRGKPAAGMNSVVQVLGEDATTGEPKICSGIIIEGCVLTGGHCVINRKNMSTASGQFGQVPVSSVTNFETDWKGDGDIQGDFAVARLDAAIPSKLGNKREMLSDEVPKKGDLPAIMGFGARETRESYAEGEKVPTLTDYGLGTRRQGTVEVLDYTPGKDTAHIPNHDPNLIKVGPAPQIGVGGDSGGPLFWNKKIVGVLSILRGEATQVQGQADRKEFLAENVRYNYFAAVAPQREKIIEMLDKLKCRENTFEEVAKRVAIQSLTVAAQLKEGKSQSLVGEKSEAVSSDLRSVFGISPNVPLTTKISKDSSKLTYELSFDRGKGPEAKTVILDLTNGKMQSF